MGKMKILLWLGSHATIRNQNGKDHYSGRVVGIHIGIGEVVRYEIDWMDEGVLRSGYFHDFQLVDPETISDTEDKKILGFQKTTEKIRNG